MSGMLIAGAARRSISPPEGIYLIGYGNRTAGNVGVHDDLYATALVLDDGRKRVAIVSLDMLAINEFIVDRVRQRTAPTECLLCCSHTHSGPIAYAGQDSPRRNREYIDLLVERISEAVESAQDILLPARLEYSSTQGKVGINRRQQMSDGHYQIGRNPSGPRDNSLQVVRVSTGEKPLATLVNYACHGTVLGPDNLLVTADWIGVMRSQEETENGGLVLFLQGAAADINPDMYWEDPQAFLRASEHGLSVAASVVEAVQLGCERLAGDEIRLERTEVWLPTEEKAETAKPPGSYRKKLMSMAHLPPFLAFMADRLLDQRYPWKPVIEARDGYWSVPMRVSGLRIGDLVLVTFAAETFTEIGTRLKAASPARHTLFASVTDGCISYLHTEASHPQGGYEVDIAPFPYRYPGRLQASCEQIALRAAAELLKRLWD